MRYGICCGLETVAAAAEAGLDYFEGHTVKLLRPLDGEAAFEETLAALKKAALPCEAMNCFVPGQLKIVGPDADPPALRKYVGTVLSRAARAGVKTIVFGSGGARGVPEGFDRQAAWKQVAAFARMLAGLAGQAGVTIVVEPLSLAECNMIHTVAQGAALVKEVEHPNLRLLVDSYHWGKDNDSPDDVVAFGPLLRHVHIGTWPHRLMPGLEQCPLADFFALLRRGGYDGRVSIEAGGPTTLENLSRALAVMKSLAGEG